MDAVDQIHHIAKQVAAFHPVGESLEYRGDHIAPLAPAIVAAQGAQVGKQTGTTG